MNGWNWIVLHCATVHIAFDWIDQSISLDIIHNVQNAEPISNLIPSHIFKARGKCVLRQSIFGTMSRTRLSTWYMTFWTKQRECLRQNMCRSTAIHIICLMQPIHCTKYAKNSHQLWSCGNSEFDRMDVLHESRTSNRNNFIWFDYTIANRQRQSWKARCECCAYWWPHNIIALLTRCIRRSVKVKASKSSRCR